MVAEWLLKHTMSLLQLVWAHTALLMPVTKRQPHSLLPTALLQVFIKWDNNLSQTQKAEKAILEEIGRELCKVRCMPHVSCTLLFVVVAALLWSCSI